MQLGFVGLGVMGRPMALHLLRAGHQVVPGSYLVRGARVLARLVFGIRRKESNDLSRDPYRLVLAP